MITFVVIFWFGLLEKDGYKKLSKLQNWILRMLTYVSIVIVGQTGGVSIDNVYFMEGAMDANSIGDLYNKESKWYIKQSIGTKFSLYYI